MSENHDSAQGNGDLDGFVSVERSVDTAGAPVASRDAAAGSVDTGEASVFVDQEQVGKFPVSNIQWTLSSEVDNVHHSNRVTRDSMLENPSAVKTSDDGVKEDMFVDCPDELNPDVREGVEVSATSRRLEEKDDFHNAGFNKREHKEEVHDLKGEIEHLRCMLDKTFAEKESLAQEHELERVALAHLHHQLKALNEQQSLLNVKDDGLADHETGNAQVKTLPSDTLSLEVLNECSMFVEREMDERSQAEGTVRELHTILSVKDQELENLKARISELSVSHDAIHSFLNSIQENMSKYADVQSEIHLDKDQHIETITNRLFSSLAAAVNQEKLLDESVTGKISHVEKSTSLLIEKYNQFLSEIHLLRQCLVDLGADFSMHDETEIILAARTELLELRRKQVDWEQKLSHLDDENRKLVEQLDKHKQMIDMTNAEIGKINTELEQEKTRYANTKEKLSMAVTKGKALVQQRDSLKQSLADKASELEKCLVELQEKSSALQASELSKEALIKSENWAASLQEALSQRDMVLHECEEILSDSTVPEDPQSLDIVERVRWLAYEKNALNSISLEFHKVVDFLSSIDFPESVLSSALESQVSWLVESFSLAKDEAMRLQDEIARTREAAHGEIDHLTASFLTEMQEKNFLQEELEDLTSKYEGIVAKEHQDFLEKDRLVRLLLEASGITMESLEEVYQPHSDVAMIIDRCFEKIKEQNSASLQPSHVEMEFFERIQSLLYTSIQELQLYAHMLEEEMMNRSEVNHLSDQLAVAFQELSVLKDEKGSLQKDLERAVEKTALLREKLSMAVKKGKGLVQERENLKQLLDDKNAEIEKLKHDIQQQGFVISSRMDQINMLSTDFSKLEADLAAVKDQRDNFEQFLVESNGLLQRVMESIDGIVIPGDSVFEEPVEKVKWLAGFLSGCQDAKTQAEEELEKVKNEASTLACKLADSLSTTKSLEDALSIAKNNISQLIEERREIEIAKTHVEEELQKATDEASSLSSKFAEVSATRKSLENALSLAENNIALLTNEKEDAQASSAVSEMELQKMKEEVSILTSNLAEAHNTIQSLEDMLSKLQTNAYLLTEEKNKAQVGRNSLEDEIKKLKEEADSQAGKIADASSTIESLKDALFKAENSISDLLGEKRIAEQEISTLSSKLNACVQELDGTHGSVEHRFLELSVHLNNLHLLLKDETLLSLLSRSFEKKVESLKDMYLLLTSMKNQFVETDSGTHQNYQVIEKDSFVPNPLPADNIVNVEMVNGEGDAADADSILLYIGKTVEGVHLRDKILADKFENFSTLMDEMISGLYGKLEVIRDKVIAVFEEMKSLKQKVNILETDRHVQEDKVVALENDISILLSACTNSTQELEFEVKSNLLEMGFDPELEQLNHGVLPERAVGGVAVAEHQQRLDSSQYFKQADKLLFAVKNVQILGKQFQNVRNTLATTIEDLRNKLKESRTICEKSIEERDLNQRTVLELETNLEALQDSCSEMRLKLEDYLAKEYDLTQKEAELSSMYTTSIIKGQEAEDSLLSNSQMEFLFDKINAIEIPFAESKVEYPEPHNSAHVKKLFSIVDSIARLQDEVTSLSLVNQNLQSSLEEQGLEIEHLKEEVEGLVRNKQDSEKMKRELLELTLGLENIIQKLGGHEMVESRESAGPIELLLMLEKLIMANILESENSKSKAQELDVKLLETQKFVEELSSKVKLLEESKQGGAISPEALKEKGISEASLPSRSEISEVEDVGPAGQKATNPVPSSAHVRTLRKGSSDHLAINIDSESVRLINHEETDEDKGHVFKSLSTSGLIPKQGKVVADRIDGIWVSSGRALMSHPRARLGLIAYWLFLHIWLVGTIL